MVYELHLAAAEELTVEQHIAIEAKLNPNWTEKDSEDLRKRIEEDLTECRKNLEEARANYNGVAARVSAVPKLRAGRI